MANKYFYIGAFSSIFLYSLIALLLFLSISNNSSKTLYANKNKTSFEVSIVDTIVKKPQPKIPVPKEPVIIPKKIIKPKEPKVEGGTSLKKSSPNLDSLFDDISDNIEQKKFNTKKEEVKKSIQSKKEGTKKEQKSKKASDIIKKITSKNQKIVFESTDGINDPYKQKIHNIISSKITVLSGDFGLKTTVVVSIDRYGKLKSFKITKLSNNQDFDSRFLAIMQSLMIVEFPINNKDSIIEFNITITEL